MSKKRISFYFTLLPAFRVALPSSGGDLDGEVGWGQEGEDLGGDVVAAVVHAFAEYLMTSSSGPIARSAY